MEKLTAIIDTLAKSARGAPDIFLEIALVYSILILIFLIAALIRKSKGAYILAVFFAIGLTGVFSAVKLIKIKPASPPPKKVTKKIEYYTYQVKGSDPDEVIMKFAEYVFDKTLGLKELGFNKLPPYQKEILSNRLIPVSKIEIKDTLEGYLLTGQVEKKKAMKLFESLGYKTKGENVIIDVENYLDVGLSAEEANFIAEGIKRSSIYFLDNKFFSDIKHLKQELVGMELKKGIIISEVTGTSQQISLRLKRK